MSLRTDRLNSEMRKEISAAIGRLKDPRVSAMTAVTGVEVAADLKTAKVYVSVYGEAEEKKATIEALTRAAGHIRRELAAAFRFLRTVPALEFRPDNSLEYGSKIDSILEEIKKGDDAD